MGGDNRFGILAGAIPYSSNSSYTNNFCLASLGNKIPKKIQFSNSYNTDYYFSVLQTQDNKLYHSGYN